MVTELLNMLTMAQKAIQGNKEKEVALVASSSRTKKKGNKKKKERQDKCFQAYGWCGQE